jgi:hypothetical protein
MLTKKHREKCENAVAEKQKNREDSVSSVSSEMPERDDENDVENPQKRKTAFYGRTHPKKVKVDTLVARFIAEDFQAFSVVQAPSFQRLVSGLDHRYKLPDRNTVANSIMPNLYDVLHSKLTRLLASTKYV